MSHRTRASMHPQYRLVYHEDPFMDVHWHDDIGIPRLYWKRFSATGAYRKAMDKLIDLAFEKQACVCWLDLSALSVVDKEDQTWIKENWLPRTVEIGVRHIAVTMPSTTLAKTSLLKGLRYEDSQTLEIGYFSHAEEPLNWLLRLSNNRNK